MAAAAQWHFVGTQVPEMAQRVENLQQSSKPAKVMMGKKKARKEEALPRTSARRMQHIIPGTEVTVSTAVPRAQPDLPNHRELK